MGPDEFLTRADARVHRCGGCGGWVYSRRPCTTCAIAARVEHEDESEAA